MGHSSTKHTARYTHQTEKDENISQEQAKKYSLKGYKIEQSEEILKDFELAE